MDAFFASVEQRDHPSLMGKPIAVGGSRVRGVVAAASYEARAFGVRSAMASSIAYRKCPQLIFVKPRFEVYKQVSLQIRAIFGEYTHLIEPLSLDEAYLDITVNKKNLEFAMDVADEIRAKVKARTGLTCSAGISYNKFLAKIATEVNKPNGMFVITPKKAEGFIEQLPIEKFFGVGKVTAQKMRNKGITNGLELKSKTKDQLQTWFGKAGGYYYQVARGIDERPVNPNRIRKSLGAESTFGQDLVNLEQLKDRLTLVIETLITRLESAKVSGRTLTLKVKYANFTQITRSKTALEYLTNDLLYTYSDELLHQIPHLEDGIRLLGLQVSNFDLPDGDVPLGQLEFQFDET